MNKNVLEIVVGVVALMMATLFISYVIRTGLLSRKTDINFILKATFTNIDGIKIGSDVKIGGVKVGTVRDVELNSDTFQVSVTIAVSEKLRIPVDSSLSVTSSGIFGSKYLAIKPGFEESLLQNNDVFTATQSSSNLEDLISKFATSHNPSGK